MKDSVTYQAITQASHEEGMAEGERRLLLGLGERRFGPPSATVRLTLESLSLSRLDELGLRLLDVESWDDLLAE